MTRRNQVARLVAALLLTAIVQIPASAETKVFLLGGQSNMAGVGGYSGYNVGISPWGDPPGDEADEPCPSIYANQPDVKFWDYTPNDLVQVYPVETFPNDLFLNNPGVGGSWINLQNGYGYMTDQFGPELSFGARLHEIMPTDEIYLVKLGVTSTSLAVDWNASGTGGTVFNRFKARVDAAMQNLIGQGKAPTIAGMVWMQGEQDSNVTSYANAYAQNLTNLVTTIRSDFTNAADMKFVVGRIAPTLGTEPTVSIVRAAQEDVSALVGNASWVNTDDLQIAYYGHYGTQGQIDLGTRFANEFVAPEPSVAVMTLIGFICISVRSFRNRALRRRMPPKNAFANV